MNRIEAEAIELEMEPHDVSALEPASLWELCRSFDAEMGKSLKGIYSGLCLFEYYKQQMETRATVIIGAKGGH